MEIMLTKDNETISYDTTKISDSNKQAQANTIVSKVATIEVILEALAIANNAQRNALENLLQDSEEAIVSTKNESAEEESIDKSSDE
jgi:hypothetical protein